MDFVFNASALAAGAVIERGPVITTTTSVGSVVLTPSGGEGRTVVTDYFSDELEIAHAETKVSGRGFVRISPDRKEEPRFASWTSVLMKGVKIFGRVEVDEMGTTIASTRGFEDDDDQDFTIQIWFKGVKIRRKKRDQEKRAVEVVIDEKLRKTARYDGLSAFLGSERAATSMAKRTHGTGEELMENFRKRKHIRLSLVQGIRGFEEETVATVPVEGLGLFRFGELLLKPGVRRVNLIRATFGDDSAPTHDVHEARLMDKGDAADAADAADEAPDATEPLKGSMILGSGEGNGTPVEP